MPRINKEELKLKIIAETKKWCKLRCELVSMSLNTNKQLEEVLFLSRKSVRDLKGSIEAEKVLIISKKK